MGVGAGQFSERRLPVCGGSLIGSDAVRSAGVARLTKHIERHALPKDAVEPPLRRAGVVALIQVHDHDDVGVHLANRAHASLQQAGEVREVRIGDAAGIPQHAVRDFIADADHVGHRALVFKLGDGVFRVVVDSGLQCRRRLSCPRRGRRRRRSTIRARTRSTSSRGLPDRGRAPS